MIEKIVLDYLSEVLSVSVYLERPPDPEAFYVVIEKTGSTRRDQIYTASLAVQSYAPSLYEAAALNETVKAAMFDAVSLAGISKVALSSDYNFTNPAVKQYRYQAVFEITHY